MAPTEANAAGMNDTTALRVSSLSTSRSARNFWATACRLASGLPAKEGVACGQANRCKGLLDDSTA